MPLQSYGDEVAARLLAAGAHNELAVFDPKTLEVRSGIDGIFWSLEGSWIRPLLPLLRLAPARLPLALLYRLVAFNRRILSPVRGGGMRCACDPDFHLGLRLTFTALCWAGLLLLGWAYGALAPVVALGGTLAAASLLLRGQAGHDARAHAAWCALLVALAGGLVAYHPAYPLITVPALVLLLLARQRREALSLGAWGSIALTGLGALVAILAFLFV